MSFTFICQDNAFMLYVLAMDNQILAHLPVSCFFPLDLICCIGISINIHAHSRVYATHLTGHGYPLHNTTF